jgi:hypothetical protein
MVAETNYWNNAGCHCRQNSRHGRAQLNIAGGFGENGNLSRVGKVVDPTVRARRQEQLGSEDQPGFVWNCFPAGN